MSYLDADFARVSPVSVPTQAPPCCRPTLVCSILQLNQTIIFGGCCRWKGWVDVVDPGRSWVSPTNGKRPHPPQPAPLTFCISNIFVLECFSPSQFIPKWKCFSLGLLSCWGSILWPKDGLNQQQHIGRPVVMPPLLLLLYLHFADVLQFLALMMLWSIWKQGRLDLGRLRHRFC